jgi:uncharacterized protein YqgV (UPF0045/DUF77 family)
MAEPPLKEMKKLEKSLFLIKRIEKIIFLSCIHRLHICLDVYETKQNQKKIENKL